MNLNYNKKEEPLLKREKIEGEVIFKGKTPSKKEIKEEILKKENAKKELIKIKKIQTLRGKQKAKFTAYIYKELDFMHKIEGKPKEEKKDNK